MVKFVAVLNPASLRLDGRLVIDFVATDERFDGSLLKGLSILTWFDQWNIHRMFDRPRLTRKKR